MDNKQGGNFSLNRNIFSAVRAKMSNNPAVKHKSDKQSCNKANSGMRIAAGFVGLVCLVILVVAAFVKPDPSGMGSHKQLGQPACGFYERTGYPCPTCGMTTAFAHMARGHIIRSFAVQPAGALGAIICVAALVVCSYISILGRRMDKLLFLLDQQIVNLLFLAGAIVLLSWGWQCFLTYLKTN